jgi:AbrB family looped-hinge helix DNA binding protein
MKRRYISSVSPKGQITLPIEIRRQLNIRPRDHVDIELVDGAIRVTPWPYNLDTVMASVPALPFPYVDGETEHIAWEDAVVEKYVKLLQKA